MKEIPLTQGKVAIVDDADYEWLMQWKWCAANFRGKFYAIRAVNEKLKRTTIQMHRQIMDTPPGMETDHINGNSLDNRRENLRVCTVSQNQMNRRTQKNNTSGYKGVSYSKHRKKWFSQIQIDKKRIFLGLFLTPENAARAYDEAAKRYFGEFTKTNFEL